MKNTFKKITSVILAMFILMSVSITAFAAPGSGEYVGGNAFQSELEVMRILEKYEDEEPLWDYGSDDHIDNNFTRYTDENGTVWKFYDKKNYVFSKENKYWIYRILDDGTIAVTPNPEIRFEEGALEVTVPSELDGKTVTVLDDWSSPYVEILSVIVPDTVTELGPDCFWNCKYTKRVVLPESIKSMNELCFDGNDDIELYYTGSEEQWNDIIVYHTYDLFEKENWAVTGFDWLGGCYADPSDEDVNSTGVKAVHYNVDPDTLPPVEDLIEEEPAEPTFWEKVAQAFENFADSIVVFFEKVANWFASIFA